MSSLRLISAHVAGDTLVRSRTSPRKRANLNIHAALDEPVQRFLNVLQTPSYVRPHRHGPEVFELLVALSGRAAVIVFDGAGDVAETTVIGDGAAWGVEVAARSWHTLLALAADTVLLEVKPGPYQPLAEQDFAAWAPREGDPAAATVLASWRALVEP